MKRDMELARKILLQIESEPEAFGPFTLEEIKGYSEEAIGYHVYLLGDAELIEVQDHRTMGRHWDYKPMTLTMEGHEFIAAAADDVIWKKSLEVAKAKTGVLTLAVISETLKWVTKELLAGRLSGVLG